MTLVISLTNNLQFATCNSLTLFIPFVSRYSHPVAQPGLPANMRTPVQVCISQKMYNTVINNAKKGFTGLYRAQGVPLIHTPVCLEAGLTTSYLAIIKCYILHTFFSPPSNLKDLQESARTLCSTAEDQQSARQSAYSPTAEREKEKPCTMD